MTEGDISVRNPFRMFTRSREVEKRDLDVGSVSWPLESLGLAEPVSVDRALRLAPVFAAGRLLASSVSSLPLQVYRKTGNDRERIPTPSLFEDPSAVGTLRDWLFRVMTSLVYRGNGVGLITERDWREFPTTTEWLDPADVTVEDSRQMMGRPGSFTDPIWTFRGERLPTSDVVHIPWFTYPGRVWGLSPLAAYASSVSRSLAAERFTNDWFASGGVPPGTFRNAEQVVDQQKADVIKQRLMQAIRTHQPIVYGRDWEYNPITVSPNEARFVETMQLGASQIAHIYGIPPELLGGETGGSYTYSSPEQRQIEFVQVALLPWLELLESHFSKLLPRGQYVKFNADALIRTDARTRYGNYKIAREIGLTNIDELRSLEDLPPIPGEQGQDYTPLPIKAKSAGEEPADQDEEPGGQQRLRLIESDGTNG